MNTRTTRRGLTLVELVLAIGLLSLLMLAVFQLFDRSISVWRRGETRRALLETASVVLESLSLDLAGLEPGTQGDFLLEWVRFDTNGDGLLETKWPQLRLVRQASGAEMARAAAGGVVAQEKAADSAEANAVAREAVLFPTANPGLLEVVWTIQPASLSQADARAEGVIYRGERPTTELSSKSFLAGDFFGASHRPPAGATDEVTGGLLWISILCAGQTSVVNDGWHLGEGLDTVATSWDAHALGRPNRDAHPWNEPHVGQPKAKGRALIPRRVRIDLEFERPVDRLRRTKLVQPIDNQEGLLQVDDGRRVPTEKGSFILIDAEWMRITSIDDGRVTVQRAQRGTTAAPHTGGAMVHWGTSLSREVTVATYREDWNL